MKVIFEKKGATGSIDIDYDFPKSRKPCLTVTMGNECTKYATFANKAAADEFVKIFESFLEAKWL